MTLRLVRDEPPKAPPKRRKWQRAPLLTPDEESRFRAAMQGLQGAFGSWPCLAKAMNVKTASIHDMMAARVHVSGDMIVRAMKASGLAYADLVSLPTLAGTCRACGAVRRAS